MRFFNVVSAVPDCDGSSNLVDFGSTLTHFGPLWGPWEPSLLNRCHLCPTAGPPCFPRFELTPHEHSISRETKKRHSVFRAFFFLKLRLRPTAMGPSLGDFGQPSPIPALSGVPGSLSFAYIPAVTISRDWTKTPRAQHFKAKPLLCVFSEWNKCPIPTCLGPLDFLAALFC